jgi:hypothetical protein
MSAVKIRVLDLTKWLNLCLQNSPLRFGSTRHMQFLSKGTESFLAESNRTLPPSWGEVGMVPVSDSRPN